MDCRINKRASDSKHSAKVKGYAEKVKNEAIDSEKAFRFCTESGHNAYGSPYPSNMVPTKLFRKIPDDPNSDLLTQCKHCRDHDSTYAKQRANALKIVAKEKGIFCCSTCTKSKNMDNMAINADGTNSSKCKDCKIKEKYYSVKLRDSFNKIRLEFIDKYQSSCYICNNIYLSDKINNLAKELATYIRDDIRYVKFEDKEYISADFIKSFNSQLELIILQFDHLTKEEQLERRMIQSSEEFFPKRCGVSECTSEFAMRLEAKKCQLICARCHKKETIRRGKGTVPTSLNTREKLKFTDDLKKSGCVNCGYKDPDLPKFFDFDHIKLDNKIMAISEMAFSRDHTIEEFKKEISKCRILCCHCHIIHTKIQWDNGIIHDKMKAKINNANNFLSASENEMQFDGHDEEIIPNMIRNNFENDTNETKKISPEVIRKASEILLRSKLNKKHL